MQGFILASGTWADMDQGTSEKGRNFSLPRRRTPPHPRLVSHPAWNNSPQPENEARPLVLWKSELSLVSASYVRLFHASNWKYRIQECEEQKGRLCGNFPAQPSMLKKSIVNSLRNLEWENVYVAEGHDFNVGRFPHNPFIAQGLQILYKNTCIVYWGTFQKKPCFKGVYYGGIIFHFPLTYQYTSFLVCFLFVCFLPFLGPIPQHMAVPRLGVQSEL